MCGGTGERNACGLSRFIETSQKVTPVKPIDPYKNRIAHPYVRKRIGYCKYNR